MPTEQIKVTATNEAGAPLNQLALALQRLNQNLESGRQNFNKYGQAARQASGGNTDFSRTLTKFTLPYPLCDSERLPVPPVSSPGRYYALQRVLVTWGSGYSP